MLVEDYKLKQLNSYQLMKEEMRLLEEKGEVPRLLLHSCCAPCSSHVISELHEHFKITILYYNPNIEPYAEYEKRKAEEVRFIGEYPAKYPIDIMDCDYDNDKFHDMVRGMEDLREGGDRCFLCYELRVRKTFEKAIENGYDYFATTLTVSPYKNSKKLNEIGNKIEQEYKDSHSLTQSGEDDILQKCPVYLVSDFKKNNGYKHSIELSKEYGLYRQDYCGCVFSKRDHDIKVENQREKES